MINALGSVVMGYFPKNIKEPPSSSQNYEIKKEKTQNDRKSMRLDRRGSLLDHQDVTNNKTDGPLNREARGMILQYLTKHLSEVMTSAHCLSEFEQLVEVATKNIEDLALLRVLKAHGWKGHRFFHSQSIRVDASALMIALSNLYLQTSVATLTAMTADSSLTASMSAASNGSQRLSISQKRSPSLLSTNMERQSSSTGKKVTAAPMIEGADELLPATVEEQLMDLQVLSFCPNILVKHLLARMDMEGEEILDVSSSSFEAACMLVDISGFSKYSGAMCSKGVVGLDDLHKSTNEFLGHFVDVVHRYQGDVVCFAGDALICVFCVEQKKPNHSSPASFNIERPLRSSPASFYVEKPARASPSRKSISESRGSLIDGLFGVGGTSSATPKRNALGGSIGLNVSSGKGEDNGNDGETTTPLANNTPTLDTSSSSSSAFRLNVSAKSSFNVGTGSIGLLGSLGGGPLMTDNSVNGMASRRPSMSYAAANNTPLDTFRGGYVLDRSITASDFNTPLASARGPSPAANGAILSNIGRIGSSVKNLGDHISKKLTDYRTVSAPTTAMDPWNNYCLRALQCACELRATKDDNLGTHIAVTAGTLTLAILGGCNEEWSYIINGPCLSELSNCIDNAGVREVVCSQSCYDRAALFSPTQKYIKVTEKNPEKKYMLPQQPISSINPLSSTEKRSNSPVSDPLAVEAIAPSGTKSPITTNGVGIDQSNLPDLLQNSHHDEETEFDREKLYLVNSVEDDPSQLSKHAKRSMGLDTDDDRRETLLEILESFTPFPALNAIYAESLESIAELRQVTTMFLKLDSYSPEDHRDPISLQSFFFLLQDVLEDSGGFLRQFLVDDKGCVAIAMWGVPCFTFANDCSRGLFCAVAMSQRVQHIQHRCSIGLTTGNVYCGNVGSVNRRDYVGIGDTVNLAARLMGKANGRVFIDAATHDSLPRETKSRLTPLEYELHLKGQSRPMRPYYYSSSEPPAVPMGDDIASNNSQYVVLNAEIAAQFGRQLDRVCLPSMRNTFVADPLMTAGANALNMPMFKGSQEDLLNSSSRQLKNALIMNRSSSKHKLSQLGNSNHSKSDSSNRNSNRSNTKSDNSKPLFDCIDDTAAMQASALMLPYTPVPGGNTQQNTLQNTSTSLQPVSLERRRSSVRKGSIGDALGALVFAAGFSSKVPTSMKSNESSDLAQSQRSNRLQTSSKRVGAGGGVASSRIHSSTRIQKRRVVESPQSSEALAGTSSNQYNGRRPSTSDHSVGGDVEPPAKLNFCVLVGDVGSGKTTAAEQFLVGARRRKMHVVDVRSQPGDENVNHSIVARLFWALLLNHPIATNGSLDLEEEATRLELVKQVVRKAYPTLESSNLPRWLSILGAIHSIIGMTEEAEADKNDISMDRRPSSFWTSTSRSPSISTQALPRRRSQFMGKRNAASRKSSVGAGYMSQKSNVSDQNNNKHSNKSNTPESRPKKDPRSNWSRKSDDSSSAGNSSREGGGSLASPTISHKSASTKGVSGVGSGHRLSLNDLIAAVTLVKPGSDTGLSPTAAADTAAATAAAATAAIAHLGTDINHSSVEPLTLGADVTSNTPPALDSWRNSISDKDIDPVVGVVSPGSHQISNLLANYEGSTSKVATSDNASEEAAGGGGGRVVFPTSISAEALALAKSISKKNTAKNSSVDRPVSEIVRKPSRKQSIAALMSTGTSVGVGTAVSPIVGLKMSSKASRASHDGVEGLGRKSPSAKGPSLARPNHLDRKKPSSRRTPSSSSTNKGSNKRRDKQLMLAFYDVIKVLLAFPLRTAILIEDAQYCDELSWIELSRWPDMLANTTILLTILGRPSAGSAFSNKLDADLMIHVQGGDADDRALQINRRGIALHDANRPILFHPDTTIIELTGLKEVEVKELVGRYLCMGNTDRGQITVSDELVQQVLSASAGSPFWCSTIAKFIQERGVEEFTRSMESDQKGLNFLVICRLEQLISEHQSIAKYASIIGSEFTETMLSAILPNKLNLGKIKEACGALMEIGFVVCTDNPNTSLFNSSSSKHRDHSMNDHDSHTEHNTMVFKFQNDFISRALYQLTPPSEAARVHLAVAEFIESQYDPKDLHAHYETLVHHYKQCSQQTQSRKLMRYRAFKYACQAAAYKIENGSYIQGHYLCTLSMDLADTANQLNTLLTMVNGAYDDLTMAKLMNHLPYATRASVSAKSVDRADEDGLLGEYKEMVAVLGTKIKELTKDQDTKSTPDKNNGDPVGSIKVKPLFTGTNNLRKHCIVS